MASTIDKKFKEAARGVIARDKAEKLKKAKSKLAAIKYGDIEQEFEIVNTVIEPLKKAKNKAEGRAILKKAQKRRTSKNLLEAKRNPEIKKTHPSKHWDKAIDLREKWDKEEVKKAGGGKLGIDNAGQKLVQKLYSKGGKV
jgi:hypothetical protein